MLYNHLGITKLIISEILREPKGAHPRRQEVLPTGKEAPASVGAQCLRHVVGRIGWASWMN